jgi:hypothetical protein
MAFEDIYKIASLVDNQASCWTGKVALTLEDLGLEKDHMPHNISLGDKRLVPKEALAPLQSRVRLARKVLEVYGFAFPWGSGRLVFHQAMPIVIDKLEQEFADYHEALKVFEHEYDSYKLKMRPEWTKAATQAHFRSLNKKKHASTSFISNFLSRIYASYPSFEEIRHKFRTGYSIHKLVPSDVSVFGLDGAAYQKQAVEDLRSFILSLEPLIATRMPEAFAKQAQSLRQDKKRVTYPVLDSLVLAIDNYLALAFYEDEEVISALKNFKEHEVMKQGSSELSRDLSRRFELADKLEEWVEFFDDKERIPDLITTLLNRIGV